MIIRSLQSRIVILFVSLILVVQVVGYFAIHTSISSNAKSALDQQLMVGEHIFNNFIDQNAKNLTLGASILAADYGFRQALSSDDHDTIVSALKNHRQRIGASLAMLFSANAERKGFDAETEVELASEPIAMLVDEAKRSADSRAKEILILNGHPYQFVVVPIKAPLTIGWIVMGFKIDDAFAKQLHALSNLDVSFLTGAKSKMAMAVATTLDAESSHNLLSQSDALIASVGRYSEIKLDGFDYGTRTLRLSDPNGNEVLVVLQSSISKATEFFLKLQKQLLILTVIGAGVFVAGSIFTARRITKPVTELAEAAHRLEQGQYDQVVKITQNDEIGDLGRALDRMREGIAERESKITALAYWDALTSLPNRAYFIEKIEELIAAHAHSKAPFSVLILNLNRFKFINDVLGHAFADQILKSVGERIRNLSVRNSNDRAADVVVRLGGDEFGILMAGVTAKLACEIATRILKDLETPISIDDQTVDIGASVGVASFPEHSTNLSFLISRAEIAMYTAKSRGLNILVYDPIYDQSSQENLTLLSELKTAIAQNELVLYVQPKLNLETAQMTGVEALVRWMHPKRGFMPPDSFIPFAEQTGYVREITLWVLNEAAAWASQWQQNGLDINIAVNLSVRDLMDLQLPQKVEEILAKNMLKPDRISLEITESTIMDDPERALSTVKQLHALGLKLAIDDFGTGYSSLAYLKQLPVSELKIDKSFVLNMENDVGDHMIVRSTIDLGRNLSLKIIAEGVENEKTWHMLKAAGCHFAQGYFMSKPIPAKDLEAWILKWDNDIEGEKSSLRQAVALEI